MFKIKGIHISEHKGHKEMSLHSEMKTYLDPEYVYIPLIEGGAVCEALVSVGDKVLLGQQVANRTGRFPLPVHSPVSGEVTNVNKKMWHASGKMVACIEIKNDHQETKIDTIKSRNVDDLTKDDIIAIMKDCGLVGLGGASFPTYVKNNSNAPIEYLLINGAECEPYINNDYTILSNPDLREKFLRGIKYSLIANGAKQVYIAIKETKKHLIEELNEVLKAYDNISVFELKDVYPAGWEKYIVQHVTNRTYNMLPSEAGCVVQNVATVLALCDAVEQNKPLIEKVVTITGKGINNPCVVYTKIGVKTSELIALCGGYVEGLNKANSILIAGGPMTGTSVMFDEIVVHRAFGDVIVMPNEAKKDNPNCLGCGKCASHCPVKLTPILIKNAIDAKDTDECKLLNAMKCMQCGMCSYVCPSRIELTEAVGKAKAALMKR